jgi:acetyl-CoA acetyltransferase
MGYLQQAAHGYVHDTIDPLFNYEVHLQSSLIAGNCGEQCASKYGISRADQEVFSKQSNERAITAWSNGALVDEVAPITIQGKKGNVVISKDEGIESFEPTKMSKLRSLQVLYFYKRTIDVHGLDVCICSSMDRLK